jgi:hypothetical protein
MVHLGAMRGVRTFTYAETAIPTSDSQSGGWQSRFPRHFHEEKSISPFDFGAHPCHGEHAERR